MKVYHGTKANIEHAGQLKPSEGTQGIFFTPDKEYAQGYSDIGKGSSKLLAAHVDIKNPAVVFTKKKEYLTPEDVKELEDQGHDGLFVAAASWDPFNSKTGIPSGKDIEEVIPFHKHQIIPVSNTSHMSHPSSAEQERLTTTENDTSTTPSTPQQTSQEFAEWLGNQLDRGLNSKRQKDVGGSMSIRPTSEALRELRMKRLLDELERDFAVVHATGSGPCPRPRRQGSCRPIHPRRTRIKRHEASHRRFLATLT